MYIRRDSSDGYFVIHYFEGSQELSTEFWRWSGKYDSNRERLEFYLEKADIDDVDIQEMLRPFFELALTAEAFLGRRAKIGELRAAVKAAKGQTK